MENTRDSENNDEKDPFTGNKNVHIQISVQVICFSTAYLYWVM
jgi:hypothetical protein